jgi:aspartate 1-decarboxylase
VGEELIIMGFELSNDLIKPRVVLVDHHNAFVQYLNGTEPASAAR